MIALRYLWGAVHILIQEEGIWVDGVDRDYRVLVASGVDIGRTVSRIIEKGLAGPALTKLSHNRLFLINKYCKKVQFQQFININHISSFRND